jgi:hypothetical protein
MRTGNTELSGLAILGIAAAFAIVGVFAYALLTPISPAQLVALEHAAVNEVLAR